MILTTFTGIQYYRFWLACIAQGEWALFDHYYAILHALDMVSEVAWP